MSIDSLVREGSIHPFRAPTLVGEIAKVMSIARRDLDEAEKIHGTSLDWTFSIAYSAVLQACRAYMFHMGYRPVCWTGRPATSEAHKATFKFMQITVDESMKQAIDYFFISF